MTPVEPDPGAVHPGPRPDAARAAAVAEVTLGAIAYDVALGLVTDIVQPSLTAFLA